MALQHYPDGLPAAALPDDKATSEAMAVTCPALVQIRAGAFKALLRAARGEGGAAWANSAETAPGSRMEGKKKPRRSEAFQGFVMVGVARIELATPTMST